MPEECSSPKSNWTFETLQFHLSERIDGLRASIDAARLAAERAADKAEEAFAKRLDEMNQFRGAMQDQQRTLATHGDLGALEAKVDASFRTLNDRMEVSFKAFDEKMDIAAETRTELSLQIRDIEARTAGKKENISQAGVLYLLAMTTLSLFVAFGAFILALFRK
jgi:hypothetical protein